MLRYTPIHRACWGSEPRHTKTVQVLLEAGVPFDQPSSDGNVPITMANNNAKTRKLLKKWSKKKSAAKPNTEL